MKIASVGSREYPNLSEVSRYVQQLPADTEIVSGGARGVDSVAALRAQQRGLKLKVFEAKWTQYGKRAGFMRNVDIVHYAEKIVAFHDGTSRGTAHTIMVARELGKPVEVHYPDGRIEVKP